MRRKEGRKEGGNEKERRKEGGNEKKKKEKWQNVMSAANKTDSQNMRDGRVARLQILQNVMNRTLPYEIVFRLNERESRRKGGNLAIL
jgi:hypothetical protein